MRLAAALLLLPATVAAVLWFAAAEFGGSRTAPDSTSDDDPGRRVYMTRCISCHQANGKGISAYFPPLDGTEWVGEEKGRLIRIVLHGMTGPTTVRGVEYNGAMPAWGPVLSDAEIASVLTFIRTSWSNSAPAVSEADVAAVRTMTADRTAPWTHDELMKADNRRVPAVDAHARDSDEDHEG